MSKLYFIKHQDLVQAERMRDKMAYWYEVELFDQMVEGKITCEDREKMADRMNELDNAIANIVPHGYQAKAEWKYIEVIKKYANERTILDCML